MQSGTARKSFCKWRAVRLKGRFFKKARYFYRPLKLPLNFSVLKLCKLQINIPLRFANCIVSFRRVWIQLSQIQVLQ
jgi:hypothetical protein